MSATRAAATGLAHLLVALVIGVGAGAAAVVWLTDRRDSAIDAEQATVERLTAAAEQQARPGANDRLDAAVDELLRDGVHVTADGRSMMSVEAERGLEAELARAPVGMYVVVWAPRQQVGMDDSTLRDAVEQALRDRLGDERAALFVWEGPQQGQVALLPEGGYLDGYGSTSDFAGDAATFLGAAARAITTDDFYEPRDDTDGGSDYWGGVGGGTTIGLFLGGTIVAVVLGLAKLVALGAGRKRLLPGGWGWRGTR